MSEVNYLEWSSLALVVAGALNWGLVALGQLSGEGRNAYNLVYLISQAAGTGAIESGFYVIVGLAGLYQVYFGYELYEDQ
ncbi:MAG: DUF378 domain-containing protein [Candidatus Nanohaloarchaea archaeon]